VTYAMRAPDSLPLARLVCTTRIHAATPLIARSCMRTARARRPGVSAFPSIAAALAIPSNQERRSVLAGVPVL